jgi:hypothetical protein
LFEAHAAGKNGFYVLDKFFLNAGLLDRISMRAYRPGRYPRHVKPLKQLSDPVESVDHAKLLSEQLPDIRSANAAAAPTVLQLLFGLEKRFFLRLAKALRAPVMRVLVKRSTPSSTTHFSHRVTAPGLTCNSISKLEVQL